MDDTAATGEWLADEFDRDAKTRNDPDTPVEQGFLLQLRDNPDDLAMRMVFADWLEQTAQGDKAEAVRLLAEVPVEGSPTMSRLRVLGTTLDTEWMAIVSRAPIDKCPTSNLQFRYQCPRSWEALTSTDRSSVRFCNQCNREVHFCSTLDDVRRHADAVDCVAFSPVLVRADALHAYDHGEDTNSSTAVWMGEVATDGFDAEPPTLPPTTLDPEVPPAWDDDTNRH